MTKKWLDISNYGFHLGSENGMPTMVLMNNNDRVSAEAFVDLMAIHSDIMLTATEDDRYAFTMSISDMVKLPKLLVKSKIVMMDDELITTPYQPTDKVAENDIYEEAFNKLTDREQSTLGRKSTHFWKGETFKAIGRHVVDSLDVSTAIKVNERTGDKVFSLTDGRRSAAIPAALYRYIAFINNDLIELTQHDEIQDNLVVEESVIESPVEEHIEELVTAESSEPVIEEAVIAEPAPVDPEAPFSKEPLVKHEDIGKKIGGARKDMYSTSFIASLAAEIALMSDLDGSEADVLSKLTTLEKMNIKNSIWPKPDWEAMKEEGLTIEAAGLIKGVRDSVAAKPLISRHANNDERLANHIAYGHLVESVRDRVMDLRSKEDVDNLVAYAKLVGESSGYSRSDEDRVFWYEDVANEHKQRDRVIQSSRRSLAVYSQIPHVFLQNVIVHAYRKSRGRDFHVERGEYNQTWDYIQPKRRTTESSKGGEDKPIVPVPHLEHIERKGPDYRQGRDITGEDLIETFGFSAIEYGNWLPNKERQEVLNHTYDSFKDLAYATGLNEKDMSFNGRLSLAFGSRGRSKARAHYEPAYKVINLTRMSGAGSLAHEWGHALDHYLSDKRKRTIGMDFITEQFGMEAEPSSALNARVVDSLAIKHASLQNGMPRYSEVDACITSSISYLMTTIKHKPKDKSEALAEVDKTYTEYAKHATSWIMGAYAEVVGRPAFELKEESSKIADAIKDFVLTTSRDKGSMDHKDILAMLHDAELTPYLSSKRGGVVRKVAREQIDLSVYRIENAMSRARLIDQNSAASIGWSNTDYANQAHKLDGGSKKEYWGTNIELFARAFESWVIDTLETSDRQSDYLSGHAHESLYDDATKFKGDPYPAGDERQQIDNAMDLLMNQIIMGQRYELQYNKEVAILSSNANFSENKLAASK